MRLFRLLLLVLAATACGTNANQNEPASARGGPPTSTVDDQASKNAAVYAAVVRQLVEVDHGFGGAPSPYERVYVVDGAVPHAANAVRGQSRLPAKPFASELKSQIIGQLDDLPPLAFVRAPAQVISGRSAASPGEVVHRGVLVSLGRVTWINSHEARIPNNRWATGLNGQWLTYIVKFEHGRWRVNGVLNSMVTIS